MPFARWESFAACETDMMDQGHDKLSADKICGSIEARVAKGEIYKAIDETVQVLSKSSNDLVVGGFATYELLDPEGDVMTIEGQKNWMKSLFALLPQYRTVTVDHTDFKIGEPMLKYTDPDGKEYFTHVNEKGTYIITKVRPDDGTETMRYFRDKIAKGEYGMYSISGKPKDGSIVRKLENGIQVKYHTNIEAWGYTFCRKGVNPKAKTQVISKEEKKMLKSIDLEILGKMDFATCVAEASKNPDVTDPEKLCGWLNYHGPNAPMHTRGKAELEIAADLIEKAINLSGYSSVRNANWLSEEEKKQLYDQWKQGTSPPNDYDTFLDNLYIAHAEDAPTPAPSHAESAVAPTPQKPAKPVTMDELMRRIRAQKYPQIPTRTSSKPPMQPRSKAEFDAETETILSKYGFDKTVKKETNSFLPP